MKHHIITLIALILSAGVSLGQSRSQRTDSLLDALQSQVQTLQSQVADLSEPDPAMKVLQTQVESLQAGQENLNLTQQGLGDQLKQLEEEVSQVDEDGRNDRARQRTRLTSLEANVAEGASTIQALSSSLDEVGSELSQADSAIRVQDSAIAAQDSSLKVTSKRMDEESASRMEADSSAKNLTLLGYLLAILVGVIAFILGKKAAVAAADSAKSDLSDDIRKARTEMDAGILKVDQKLMESLSRMSSEGPEVSGEGNEPDHGLALKVADEINRMENNLSRMDSTVKGHKQLTKSIERVRTNMKANGYELVALLGKPYDAGLLLEADFVEDESLAPGETLITRVNRPEIRYNGKMIQSAKIQVSQGV